MIRLNKSDYQLSFVYFIAASAWLIFRYKTEGVQSAEMAIDIFVFWLKVIVAFYLFKYLVEKFILQSQKYLTFFILFISGAIVIGTFAHLAGLFSEGSLNSASLLPIPDLIIRGFQAIGPDLTLFLGIIFSKKYYDQQLDNKNLEIENQQNNLVLLRRQFDPHFLFNNLNTIDSLIDQNPTIAKKYINHLASLYRYLTINNSFELVELNKELEFMNSYIFLLEIRFPDHYAFEVEILQDDVDFYIPTGALQGLIENVMKHNEAGADKILKTSIQVLKDKVIVKNEKGDSVDQVSSKSGLENLKRRYSMITNEPVNIYNLEREFIVELPLVKVKKA